MIGGQANLPVGGAGKNPFPLFLCNRSLVAVHPAAEKGGVKTGGLLFACRGFLWYAATSLTPFTFSVKEFSVGCLWIHQADATY
jgi:hypothetical protein